MLKSFYKRILPLSVRNRLWEIGDWVYGRYLLLTVRIILSFYPKRSTRPPSQTVLFYPHIPNIQYALYKICNVLGYTMINDPRADFQLACRFEDTTFGSTDSSLEHINRRHGCLNMQCADISKGRVQEVFLEVFGYNLGIDPRTFQGPCVKKSEINGRHDGIVIQCPVDRVEKGYVYQKVVNNQHDEKFIIELRVPIFRDSIPLVYIKYRFHSNRFGGYCKSTIAQPEDVLSKEELAQIILFAQKMDLDVGEIDILRDKDDDRIYIIDVNNTPLGPPRRMPVGEYCRALETTAQSFAEAFFGTARNPVS